jgi:hypothetical protein
MNRCPREGNHSDAANIAGENRFRDERWGGIFIFTSMRYNKTMIMAKRKSPIFFLCCSSIELRINLSERRNNSIPVRKHMRAK